MHDALHGLHAVRIHVEIEVKLSIGRITNVRDDEGMKQIADILRMKLEGGSTCLIVIANRLLRLALLLQCCPLMTCVVPVLVVLLPLVIVVNRLRLVAPPG